MGLFHAHPLGEIKFLGSFNPFYTCSANTQATATACEKQIVRKVWRGMVACVATMYVVVPGKLPFVKGLDFCESQVALIHHGSCEKQYGCWTTDEAIACLLING